MQPPIVDSMLKMQQKAVEESLRWWNRLFAMPEVHKQAMRVQVGNTPHDVVYEEDSLRLLRYRNDKVVFKEPILICYALVNRPYILDLQPQRSVVGQLLNRGFDVYLIDWGVPTAADRTMRLEDYVCGLMKNVADFIIRQVSVENLHLLGYCMGGTMSAMFTAIFPRLVKTLSLMAAPIDFDKDTSLLKVWTQDKYFDVDRLVDAYGNCPGSLLQSAFRMMKPVQNFVEKHLTFVENMDDPNFLENFFAMERWGQDNIPVAGETFREFVKCLYQRNQLIKGEFRLGQREVKLESITCPVMLLTADFDHLVPPASTLGLESHIRSTDIKKMSIHAGHVGLAVSSKAHRQFWPEALNWLVERSSSLAAT